MKNFGEVLCVCLVLAIAVALPVCLAWGLIRLVEPIGGWPLVLAQVAAGFIGIFGIPFTLYAQGLLLSRFKKG